MPIWLVKSIKILINCIIVMNFFRNLRSNSGADLHSMQNDEEEVIVHANAPHTDIWKIIHQTKPENETFDTKTLTLVQNCTEFFHDFYSRKFQEIKDRHERSQFEKQQIFPFLQQLIFTREIKDMQKCWKK